MNPESGIGGSPGGSPGGFPGGSPGSPPGGSFAPGEPSPRGSATGFQASLEALVQSGYEVPAVHLMIAEHQSGGWTGVAHVDPRLAPAERAVRTVIDQGLAPGAGVLARIRFGSSVATRAGRVARTWPSAVTAVGAAETVNGEYPFCSVSFSDPLTALCSRSIWVAYADTPLDAVVGGAVSVAAGGEGAPTRAPVLPGWPRVEIRAQVREEISTLPYVIAAGESLGLWLARICARLGVRIEMLGAPDGSLRMDLVDAEPALSHANSGGPISMTVDLQAEPSPRNLVVGDIAVQDSARARGGLLDNPSGGEAYRFGSPGPVGQVISGDGTPEVEAERRAGFRARRQVLERLRVSGVGSHPGLLPGRMIEIASPEGAGDDSAGTVSPDGDDVARGYSSMFGATLWHVARIAHLVAGESYWNNATLEKTGIAWCPPMPAEEGGIMVSGIVDDGRSAVGEPVERDQLGRIPVRFPFATDLRMGDDEPAPDGASGPGQAGAAETATSEYPWPASLPLAPVAPAAGSLHGFVSGHRQGDWCRVNVVSPLFAEVAGFSYRDDRSLKERVRDVTMGLVVRQGSSRWRGMIFRPDEEIDRELGDAE